MGKIRCGVFGEHYIFLSGLIGVLVGGSYLVVRGGSPCHYVFLGDEAGGYRQAEGGPFGGPDFFSFWHNSCNCSL